MSIRSVDHHSFLSATLAEPKQMVEIETEELKWLAEVIVGNRQSAEGCIATGLLRADGSVYVAPNWRDRWIRRCVAREAVEQQRTEINRTTANYVCNSTFRRAFEALNWDRQKLRSLTVTQVCEILNAFERAALILHLYLNFSVHDCALLIECHWSLIEPACSNALWRLFGQRISANEQAASAGFSEAIA